MKSHQQQSWENIQMNILMALDYPFLSVIDVCSNGQLYDQRQHLFGATLYLSLSLSVSLCLSAILLSPHNFLLTI